MAYSAFILPNRTFTFDRSAHHIPSRSLPFSIIIASLLFFNGRFLICLFRHFCTYFRNWSAFSKVLSALCWMPNVISLPELYNANERESLWEFRISFGSFLFFFRLLQRCKWCSNNWAESIKHYYSQLWFHTTQSMAHTEHTESKFTQQFQNRPVSSVGWRSWFNTPRRHSSDQHLLLALKTLPFISICVENWQMQTMNLLPYRRNGKSNVLSAFKCNFILTKNDAYNKLPFLVGLVQRRRRLGTSYIVFRCGRGGKYR